MKIIVKGSFDRDIDNLKSTELKLTLAEKISQIKTAKNVHQITGLKILRGYTTHGRILINTSKFRYHIGFIIRGDTIWLVRFLPRKVVYKKFP